MNRSWKKILSILHIWPQAVICAIGSWLAHRDAPVGLCMFGINSVNEKPALLQHQYGLVLEIEEPDDALRGSEG